MEVAFTHLSISQASESVGQKSVGVDDVDGILEVISSLASWCISAKRKTRHIIDSSFVMEVGLGFQAFRWDVHRKLVWRVWRCFLFPFTIYFVFVRTSTCRKRYEVRKYWYWTDENVY